MRNDPWRSLLDTALGDPKPLDYGKWPVPNSVRLEGDGLVWSGANHRRIGRTNKMFREFINLIPPKSVEDESLRRGRILRFAQHWGVLLICEEHGLPVSHNPINASNYEDYGCYPAIWKHKPLEYSEPISYWIDLIGRFRGILGVSGILHRDELPTLGDLLGCSPNVTVAREILGNRTKIWRYLLDNVHLHIQMSDLELVPFPPSANSDTPRIRLMGSGLYAALATELMFAVCRTDGLAICSSCGSPFFPTRSPRARQRAYCEPCRKRSKAPVRDAMRAYRKRIRDAVELRTSGLSVVQIADRMSVPVQRVRLYLNHAQ